MLTAVEIDPELAAMLTERFAGRAAVTIVNGDATALTDPDATFSGAASLTMLHHVPTEALQDRVFAEVARVLRPGGTVVLGDSLPSDELRVHHDGDTYNPVDPDGLPTRLEQAGFEQVEVKINPFGWAASAVRAGRA